MRHHALVEILSGGAKIQARAGKMINGPSQWLKRPTFLTIIAMLRDLWNERCWRRQTFEKTYVLLMQQSMLFGTPFFGWILSLAPMEAKPLVFAFF